MEDIIRKELTEVEKSLMSKVDGIQIIACHRNLISVKVLKTKHRELTASIQFPKDYPESILLIEIKSKVFPPSLVNHISQICDQELKKYVGQKQVVLLIKFLRKFLDENPLLPCRDELTAVKKNILQEGVDSIKMKQKQGQVSVHVKQEQYFLKCTMVVPENYPIDRVDLKLDKHNFPSVMAYYFISQAKEFARQAVEAPLKRDPKKPEFKPSPHVQKVLEFLTKHCAKRYPIEMCPICGKRTLPENPEEIVTDMTHISYAERLYCGHLYHHGCLDKFMKTPPFHG
uniref:Uncharacterized protein LOC100177726 n=1 Tax=Phallusia mammillata TaxID=59560 RepID=A0A6F9DG69_9ASCI|nr:uncharacterized protein LOC100177726 [Phallusia mammillata]